MTELNHNLDGLRLGGIRRYTALANQVGGCVMLTLGEPEFDTPLPIREAAKASLDGGCTHYTENRGSASLRKDIAEFEQRSRGLSYTADEVLVTLGATEAIYVAMTGVLNPGDEVIIPTPAFSLYGTVAQLCGAVPVPVDTAPRNFQLTAEALQRALTPRTKLLILNSPNNPTGVIYSRENLEAIRELVRNRDLFILCDDVYWGLSPCFTFTGFTDLKDRILAVQSFSKPYAMTGWRMGYLMAEKTVLERLNVFHAHTVTCAPSMLQAACLAALKWDPSPMAQSYRQRRDYVCGRLDDMKLPYATPEGAFYVFPQISHLAPSAEDFCTRLITEGKVATVPGTVFGNEGYFRMSYCCSMEQLKEGLDRLERFLRRPHA